MMTLGKGEVLRQIIEDFSSAGYTVTPHLVNARDYGVPQSRECVFLVGVHKEKIEKNIHSNIYYLNLRMVILISKNYLAKNFHG